MDPLIVQVAVTGLSEPVPVIMHVVAVILVNLGWTTPQVPSEMGWRIGGGFVADTAARFAAVAVRDFQFTELTGLNCFMQCSNVGIAAALGAVLNDRAISLLCFEAMRPSAQSWLMDFST